MTCAPPLVRCREISAADEDAVVSLLVRIFRGHDREFWIRALQRIKAYGVVPGYPQCGYLLERNGSVVGVLLLIFRSMIVDDEIRVSPLWRKFISIEYPSQAARSFQGN